MTLSSERSHSPKSPLSTGTPARANPRCMNQIYESFQDHACFCQDSLLVETKARTLVPMRLSSGQLRLRQAHRQPTAAWPTLADHLP